jgi:hypothetical protein
MDDNTFSAALLGTLPLADSVWRLLHFAIDDPWLVEGAQFRPWWASEGEDACAWQPYVDLPGPRANT